MVPITLVASRLGGGRCSRSGDGLRTGVSGGRSATICVSVSSSLANSSEGNEQSTTSNKLAGSASLPTPDAGISYSIVA